MADGSVGQTQERGSSTPVGSKCGCDRETLYQQMSLAMATLWDVQGVLRLLRESAMQNTDIPESVTATIRMASAQVDATVDKIDF